MKTQPLDSQMAEGITAKGLKPKVSCERPVWPEPMLRQGESCLLTARFPGPKPTSCWRACMPEEATGKARVDRRWHGRDTGTAVEVCRSEQQTLFHPTAEESQGQGHRSGKVLVPTPCHPPGIRVGSKSQGKRAFQQPPGHGSVLMVSCWSRQTTCRQQKEAI